ncbi:MAG: YitT family protein [Prevotellaceae bacterium]|jgi:uncharacterized membrane-anchored protein YitT (DUF2179 family)|nr:YitT family protein [Prevotellaceae bacterium]
MENSDKKPMQYLKTFYWRDYLYITCGLALYAVGLIGFIKPVGIVTGGLAGLALLVEYATAGSIPLQTTYFLVNLLLLLVALKILGVKFLIKTIYGVLLLTFLLTFMQSVITKPLIEEEPLMSAIIGAMLCGAGIGVVFNSNGSTGGTDIVVAIINKYKNIAFGRMMMFLDLIIVSMSYFVFQDFIKIVHGLIVLGVMTYTIDMVINGFRQSVQLLIMSHKYEEIADMINRDMKRGCTVLDGVGWYTKQAAKVILVLARRSEATELYRRIRDIDDKAFISQSVVRAVYGRGFDELKTKIKKTPGKSNP